MLWLTFESTFPKEKAFKRDTAGHSTSGQQFVSYSAGIASHTKCSADW